MTLRDEVIMYRAKNKLSMKNFADLVGVTYLTISNIERGIQNPSRLTEAKIRLVLEESKK